MSHYSSSARVEATIVKKILRLESEIKRLANILVIFKYEINFCYELIFKNKLRKEGTGENYVWKI